MGPAQRLQSRRTFRLCRRFGGACPSPQETLMNKITLAAALLALATSASAQLTNKAYIGGAFGASNVAVECGFPYSCDNDDTGYKFYAGYKVHPQIAIEGGYIDFGKSSISVGSIGVAGLAEVDVAAYPSPAS